MLQDALKSARGNRAKAARLLRTTERIVNYKVRKLGIDWKRFSLRTSLERDLFGTKELRKKKVFSPACS